jgi:hypothetical protein
MSQVAEVSNGKTPTMAELQAMLATLQLQLADQVAENKRILATPQAHVGATYKILEPSADGKYGRSLSVELPSGGRGILGPRRKHLDIIEEVKSGRYEAFLTAHPEVK